MVRALSLQELVVFETDVCFQEAELDSLLDILHAGSHFVNNKTYGACEGEFLQNVQLLKSFEKYQNFFLHFFLLLVSFVIIQVRHVPTKV